MSKKNLVSIRNSIIEELEEIGIMPFIIEEVWYSLAYLNYYKLKNIVDNMEVFVNEIKNINKEYYESIKRI